jgi:hypothetical protein
MAKYVDGYVFVVSDNKAAKECQKSLTSFQLRIAIFVRNFKKG